MAKTNNNITVYQAADIQKKILTIRGEQVMIDRDLAEFYGVQTKRLNEQVKRNVERFPESFCFQLSDNEKSELVANCDHLEHLKFSPTLPYAFTEQGVAMLSAVLKSETAVKMSVQIMNAFVAMRRFLVENAGLFQRLDKLELKQIDTSNKVNQILDAMQSKDLEPEQGIFFNGQVFDAWVFISDLVKKAKSSLILIDNYVDESVLSLFAKKKKGVTVDIYTRNISRALKEDVIKFTRQYGGLTLHKFDVSHDRFLLIDKTDVYHIGASLKDLGKKWFAFSKLEKDSLAIFEKLGV